MSAANPLPIALHEDVAHFREALRFTAAETGFIARLIEKDYFCTLVLQHLCKSDATLIFKGGTCLAKVYAGFYRLSEDLDFSISMPIESTRAARSSAANTFKSAVAVIPAKLQPLTIVEAVSGANGSRQYAAIVAYDSLLGANRETIKMEVCLREPVLTPTEIADARTLLLDPIRGKPMIQSVDSYWIARSMLFAPSPMLSHGTTHWAGQALAGTWGDSKEVGRATRATVETGAPKNLDDAHAASIRRISARSVVLPPMKWGWRRLPSSRRARSR